MPKIHPKPNILRWPRGLLPSSRGRVLDHLRTCPACLRAFAEHWGHGGPRRRLLPERVEGRYEGVLDAVLADLRPRVRDVVRELADAPALLAELLRHPLGRSEMLVRGSRRFRSFALCGLLLDESRRATPVDPRRAERLAALGLVLLDSFDPDFYSEGRVEDARARAWSLIGNARRVEDDLRGAEAALRTAAGHLRRGTRDPLERAQWRDFLACLRRAQRRFDEAAGHFRRVLPVFLDAGESARAAESAVGLALVEQYRGEPERALPVLRAALRLLDPRRDGRLHAIVRYNLIASLVEAGRFPEARARLAEDREVREMAEPTFRLRLRWLEARIEAGLGRLEAAAQELAAVRRGFADLASPYLAALVSLDLALVRARQGRPGAVRRLAAEAGTIFRSLGIARESLAALLLLNWAERRRPGSA